MPRGLCRVVCAAYAVGFVQGRGARRMPRERPRRVQNIVSYAGKIPPRRTRATNMPHCTRPRSPPCRRGTGACFFCSLPCGASFRCAAGEFVCNRILPLLRFAPVVFALLSPPRPAAFAARRFRFAQRGGECCFAQRGGGNVECVKIKNTKKRRMRGGVRPPLYKGCVRRAGENLRACQPRARRVLSPAPPQVVSVSAAGRDNTECRAESGKAGRNFIYKILTNTRKLKIPIRNFHIKPRMRQ